MDTTQTPLELQTLCDRIQLELESLQPLQSPVEVQCGIKPGGLRVLVQHETQFESEAVVSTVLKAIGQFLRDNPFGLGTLPSPVPVRLHLRRDGMTVPYVSRSLQVEPPDRGSGSENIELDSSLATPSMQQDSFLDSNTDPNPNSTDAGALMLLSDDPEEDETPTYSPDDDAPSDDDLEPVLTKPQSQRWAPTIALGIVVGAIALAGGVYALSRPCVIGACTLLTEAESAGQSAIVTAQTTRSALAVVDAYDQLTEASYRLGTIPKWSPHYAAAQQVLSRFESDSSLLGDVVTALRQANEAAKKSQDAPHPLPRWREIQGHWRNAIALLQQIPESSPIYPLVQRKLVEYQANLTIINQRLRVEQTAQETVKAARANAQLADTRERIAKSLSDWSQAKATWQTAVTSLKNVPPVTMMHAEAQQLLAIYEPRLLKVGDRLNQENLAQSTYEKALASASEAQRAERTSQWSDAVAAWRSAVSYARQVPSVSSYHSQVQPLIPSYQSALSTAQENLRVAVAYQNAQAELSQVCDKVCTYSPTRGAIQIRLAAAYETAVEQAIFASQNTVPTASDADVANRVNTLLWTVSSIGSSAQVPIVLFKANGSRLGTYDPDLSGYVRR